MARTDITTLFATRKDAWERRDPVALAASHTRDGVIVSPIFGRVTGHAAIEESYRELFKRFADWVLVAEEAIVEGPRAAQLFRVTATHTHELFGVPATGRRIEIHGVLNFDLAGGRIRHERRVYDFTSMLLQLGKLKARPA